MNDLWLSNFLITAHVFNFLKCCNMNAIVKPRVDFLFHAPPYTLVYDLCGYLDFGG